MQGKNDFEAIEAFRGDSFFTQALDVNTVPSCSTLCQRIDTHANAWFELASEFNYALLSAKYATGPMDFGALPCGYMAVDWDTFVMYKDHATHEQFHSEFKTDMDLERLPSGKFDTNFLVCAMAAVAMNILRLIGQNALIGKDAPLRHAAKRRRMKTVMQEIMFKAGRMIKHAGRWVLGLGANDSAYTVFERLHKQLAPLRQISTA